MSDHQDQAEDVGLLTPHDQSEPSKDDDMHFRQVMSCLVKVDSTSPLYILVLNYFESLKYFVVYASRRHLVLAVKTVASQQEGSRFESEGLSLWSSHVLPVLVWVFPKVLRCCYRLQFHCDPT